MRIIILLGRSGAGKGTQANLLCKELGLHYLGSGDLLRAKAAEDNYSGKQMKTVLAHGGFSPSALIFKLWMDKLEEFKTRDEGSFPGFVFDGSPRKVTEAYLIDEAMVWYGWKNTMRIFLLDIPRTVAFQRLLARRVCAGCNALTSTNFLGAQDTRCVECGGVLTMRFDDMPELILNRLELFQKEVEPVLAYYRKDKRLITIDGTKSIPDVYQELVDYIQKENIQ